MGMILHSGISSLEGLSIMQEETESKEGRAILEAMYEELLMTGSLYMALDSAGVFPTYMLNLIQIGEQSGRLDEVMESLAQYYQREEDIKSSIKSAVTYPCIMIGMMVAVVVVLVVKVMPAFNDVFNQLGTSVSGVALQILNFGILLKRYSMVLLAILALVIAIVVIIVVHPKGKQKLTQISYSFCLTRKFTEKRAVARFASGMAMTLNSGLDIDQSLEMVSKIVEHPVLVEKIKKCRQMTSEGGSFAEAIIENQIFSKMHTQLINIGFRTGSVDDVMNQIAQQYMEEVDDKIHSFIAVLEPTLVAILSIIVGLILLSVMLPLMGIMSSIG
jgi:type IV pilus assembly protein PilC